MRAIDRYHRIMHSFIPSGASILIAIAALLVAITELATPAIGDASNLDKAELAIAKGDYVQAAQLLHPLAQSGDIQAQVDLAALTLSDKNVGLKPDKAIVWLTSAAKSGNGPAAARLGLAYAKGEHVARDDLAAYRWLTHACQSKLPSDEALTIAKSNRDAVMMRLTPAQREAALAQQDVPAAGSTSVAVAATTPPAATTAISVATSTRSHFRVQIGSLQSYAEAETEWRRLQRKYPGLLANKQNRIDHVELAEIGERFRLTAGPFDGRDAARSFCTQLKSAGQDCLVANAN